MHFVLQLYINIVGRWNYFSSGSNNILRQGELHVVQEKVPWGIKTFWGTNENAVKTQICIALCSYLLLALIKKRLSTNLDIYRILQITSVSLLDKKPLFALFSENSGPLEDKGGENQLVFKGF